jgi:altronate hydrolase
MTQPTLILHPDDNLCVALENLIIGQSIQTPNHDTVTISHDIPFGHKIALCNIKKGNLILKYGQPIGIAMTNIQAGEHLHVHNIELPPKAHFDYDTAFSKPDYEQSPQKYRFDGFVRPDKKVGTRNYIGIIATVSCAASVGKFIADYFTQNKLKAYPYVDGVVALGHFSGCGIEPNKLSIKYLRRVITGYALHPNFASVLVIGLGCEKNSIESLCDPDSLLLDNRVHTLSIQDKGGTQPAVKCGISMVTSFLDTANRCHRKSVDASHLILGLECGGSDAFSGIYANPALGNAVDRLINSGGTAILSETTEIYGAEHLLLTRAKNKEIAEKLQRYIHWWENHAKMHGVTLNNNPTPGNKEGGITNIFEKSLGAVTKAGTTTLNEVYDYAEPVKENGLVFMNTPGYDPMSITGMVAGGANIVCFTTGRGTVIGTKPSPCIKLASNSQIFKHLNHDMDINCGEVANEKDGLKVVGESIFRKILKVASGSRVKSENFPFGDYEFIPWQPGIFT